MEKVELWIDPNSGGRITPDALLHSEGTIEIGIQPELFDTDTAYFHIAGFGFWFGLGYTEGDLLVQYRQHCLRIGPEFLDQDPSAIHICLSWSPEKLSFHLGSMGATNPHHEKVSIQLHGCPPAELIAWARKQSLLPTATYPTEQAFVERVHSSIAGIQHKVDQMSNVMAFWDVARKGQHIESRTPKSETNILPILHAMLSDQMFISSIEVYPEKQGGPGRLDFLFVGQITGGGSAKLCAEFKLAHSKHLVQGIQSQLLAYMRCNGTNNGT